MVKSIPRIASLATALALAVPVLAAAQAIPRTTSGGTTSGGGASSSGSAGSAGSSGGGGDTVRAGSSSTSSGSSGGGEMSKAPSYPDLRSGGGEVRSASPKGSTLAARPGPAPGGVATISGSGKNYSSSESGGNVVSVRTNPASGGASSDPVVSELTAGRGRGSRPLTANAVPRPPGAQIGGGDFVSFPFYGPWGPYYPWYGVGFGAAFVAYNPWGYGATCWGWNPYGAWYNPYSYCWNPYWSAPAYGVDYGGGAARAPKPAETTGSIRLKANPASAKVYIDGALAGVVDEFDGLNDHLELEGGRHKLELRAEGYVTHSEDITVAIGKTQTVRISLKKANK